MTKLKSPSAKPKIWRALPLHPKASSRSAVNLGGLGRCFHVLSAINGSIEPQSRSVWTVAPWNWVARTGSWRFKDQRAADCSPPSCRAVWQTHILCLGVSPIFALVSATIFSRQVSSKAAWTSTALTTPSLAPNRRSSSTLELGSVGESILFTLQRGQTFSTGPF